VPLAKQLLNLEWIQCKEVRRILEMRFAAELANDRTNIASLLDSLDDTERRLVTEMTAQTRNIPRAQRQLEDIAEKLKLQFSAWQSHQAASGQAADDNKREVLLRMKGYERRIAHLESELRKPFLSDDERTRLEGLLKNVQQTVGGLKTRLE
jgi:hypothetical protein